MLDRAFNNEGGALAKKKKVVCREWTKDEITELKAHSKARTPVAKIVMTKRTARALRQKRSCWGLVWAISDN
jgi:hypothetical protein